MPSPLESGQLRVLSHLAPDHARYLEAIEAAVFPGYRFPWRIAEAPAIIPRNVFADDVAAMRAILSHYMTSGFRRSYRDQVPERYRRPDDGGWFPRFAVTDFQRRWDEDAGTFRRFCPEIQTFPGNFLLKPLKTRHLLARLPSPLTVDRFFDARFPSDDAYHDFVRQMIVGEGPPEDTIILEVHPMSQATVVDMLLAVKALDVRLVDLCDVFVDEHTKELCYRTAVVFRDGRPQEIEFESIQVARRVYSRCVPAEVDDLIDSPDESFSARTCRAVFQDTLDAGTAKWVTHPQDFFVLFKATLVGNPAHYPPLRLLTGDLTKELATDGLTLADGVLKPAYFAGSRGVAGVAGPLDEALVDALLREHEAIEKRTPDLLTRLRHTWFWQQRFSADRYERSAIEGFVPTSPDEADAVYHELRFMWATLPSKTTDIDVEFVLLTGMTRWSRVGQPAGASFQKTAFTGTQGLLRVAE